MKKKDVENDIQKSLTKNRTQELKTNMMSPRQHDSVKINQILNPLFLISDDVKEALV